MASFLLTSTMLVVLTGGPARPQPATCYTVMSDRLQWWEHKEVSPLAKGLMRPGVMQKLHRLLKHRIELLQDCIPGMQECIDKWLDMYEAVDFYLQDEVLQSNVEPPRPTTWVTVQMMSSGNLKQLHSFLGRQLQRPVAKRLAATDQYLKRLVRDRGGPLIDRRWFCPRRAWWDR